MPFLRSATRPIAVDCFFCLSPSLLPPASGSNGESSQSGWLGGTASAVGFDEVRTRKGKAKAGAVSMQARGTRSRWQCDRCGCWNIMNERGEMVSSHPAMYDADLNSRSFSLRAKPSNSRLPSATPSSSSSSSSSRSLFCHSCQANQTLIMNMLANYLPAEDDPSFSQLYADLPAYTARLHERYPPVCAGCQPAVDDALRKADHRAQAEALGSALSRGFAKRRHGEDGQNRSVGWVEVLVWRLRGVLWVVTVLQSLGLGALSFCPSSLRDRAMTALEDHNVSPLALSIFSKVSIAWAVWNPYWLKVARSAGAVKLSGKKAWTSDMFALLAMRIIVADCRYFGPSATETLLMGQRAVFVLEILLLCHAFLSLRYTRPVKLQLVRPVPISASTTPIASTSHSPPPESYQQRFSGPQEDRYHGSGPDANPMFGHSAFPPHGQHGAHVRNGPAGQDDAMDWEPSPHAALSNGGYTGRPPLWARDSADTADGEWTGSGGFKQDTSSDWDKFGVGKQRMFGPRTGHEETGLERLLEDWGISGDGAGAGSREQAGVKLESSWLGWFKR